MKRLYIYLLAFLLPVCSLAQETVIIKRKLTGDVKEHVSVLKSDNKIREGLYQAIIGSKNALASGKYTNNVKTGVWSFYDTGNHLVQRFNYTTNTLLYEAPEDTTSNCRYLVDRTLSDTDHTTKPVIRGGRFYGYIPYLKLFRLPPDMRDINTEVVVTTIELLVSPGGRLADYVVHFQAQNYDRKVSFNIDLLSEEDKTFVPATINGEPISCRIFIRCFLTAGGDLDLY
ncbi:hypothetical protein [Mucilaginibacter polytrichastri]|uniref:Uncharacterized protein n=1 Tax=Mucilaginibacter polytrichastri TaxID=1302689 RepID=A0A1Q5ZUW3_9SPHI|nr:hypothetical protein [Mucilaginibacter polytrichastri]OKS85555.1 hypothetical protein RG47T_1001 [Mucilaginibacter polytrichastri]SFS36754.1 hypothetical protein SAMN04487890_101101 [Mucilaginibacter polytrichastri]